MGGVGGIIARREKEETVQHEFNYNDVPEYLWPNSWKAIVERNKKKKEHVYLRRPSPPKSLKAKKKKKGKRASPRKGLLKPSMSMTML